MKLINLTLKNFKGIREFELNAAGENVSIFGDNAAGKTTIADAFSWLLFGKDSQNKADFEIKTLGADGQPIHNLDHEVEGSFTLADRQLTLRKVYAEKWTKKRNSPTAEFTGHTTDYYIDGVPSQKKEYDVLIASIASEGLFKLLTNPAYFNEYLPWQDRRKILLEVCGDISDAEVIALEPALSDLPGIIGNRSMDDHKKVIAAKRHEINRELDRLPVRIDEAQRSLLHPASVLSLEGLTADLVKAQTDESAKRAEISRLENGGEVAEKRSRLRQIEADLLNLQTRQKRQKDAQIDGIMAENSLKKQEIANIKLAIASRQQAIEDAKSRIKTGEETVLALRASWGEANDEKFELTQETICPACGQDLPAEKLADAREKALAQFNLAKAGKLANIVAEGRTAAARVEELKIKVDVHQAEIDCLADKLAPAEAEAAEIQVKIDAIRAAEVKTPEMGELACQITDLENQIAKLHTGAEWAISRAKEELADIQQGIRAIEDSMAKARQHKEGQARIIELTKQQKELAAEYERLERELYLCEQFIRAKVALLTDKINSYFRYAKFKLFDQQVNGGISEVCETTYYGVPYGSGLNNGARINVGLDIINTLSEHYGFDAPIFVDNAESVTQLIPTTGQLIKLIVSAADKKLRIEAE